MRGLETFSSTAATPWGRSVTDSSRFILIMPQLLSGRDQPRPPFPALSLACSPDQTSVHRLRSAGTDRRRRPESRNAGPETQVDQATSIHHLLKGSSVSTARFPAPSRDRNRKSS